MSAWNNWYHCSGNTYGTWLRGDPRGWRARHHREHCEGDYRTPPPRGEYDHLADRSKKSMKRARVVLTPEQRKIACQIMTEALLYHRVEVIDLCVGAKHWHLLARFHPPGFILTKDRLARRLIGIAKKRSARFLSDAQLVDRGGVWGKRCNLKPINSRAHQLR